MTPGFLAKIVGLALVLVIGSVLISRTQELLDINDFSAASLDKASASVTDRTSEGNSTFDAPNPRSPFGFAEATVTVLFRPFPIEAQRYRAAPHRAGGGVPRRPHRGVVPAAA